MTNQTKAVSTTPANLTWRDLTKPQVACLMRSVRGKGFPSKRSETRVFGNLWDKGLIDGGFSSRFYLTVDGKRVLRDYMAVQYANKGSMASLRDLEEVEAYDDVVSS